MRTPLLDAMEKRLLNGLRNAEKRGAEGAKLTFHHSEAINCDFESGRLKSAGSQENQHYTVTVLAHNQLGVTSGNKPRDIELMVERAMALAKAGSVAHFPTYPPQAPSKKVKTHSQRTLGLSREQMIDSCRQIVHRLRTRDPELDIHAHCGRQEMEGLLVTSGGVCHEAASTGWWLSAGVQQTRGTDMLFASAGRSWADLNEFFDPEYIGDEIEKDLDWSVNQDSAPTGDTVVYLPPRMLGMFLSPLIMGLNGRNVAKGSSPLKNHLNESYFSDRLTLLDNPHVDFSPAATEIDADGIPTKRHTIIENGTIKMFLYDLDSAGLADTQPTGHSGCTPNSPEILPGELPSTQLLENIEDGLYIKSLIGFGQSNIANGDFSSNVALGFRIRNGKITGRIKNTMIAGNVLDMLRGNVTFSADRDPLSRLPHAVLAGVSAHSSGE